MAWTTPAIDFAHCFEQKLRQTQKSIATTMR